MTAQPGEGLRPTIGVVVVSYNSGHVLAECLGSLKDSSIPVVVVDNASSDDTCDIARRFPVTLIANRENRGFAAAVNQGFAHLETPLVLLLNPDVVLNRSPAFLEAEFLDERVGAAVATLLESDGSPQHTFQFRRFPTPWTLLFENLGINRVFPSNRVNRRYRYADEKWSEARMVEQPAGAYLLIRHAAWKQVGGFDEHYWPLWFEDVDFCLRLARNQFLVRYVPAIAGVHSGGHSIHPMEPSLRQLYWYRSLLQFAAKHFSDLWVRTIALSVALSAMGKALLMLAPSGKFQKFRIFKPTAMLGFQTMLHGRPPSIGPRPQSWVSGDQT